MITLASAESVFNAEGLTMQARLVWLNLQHRAGSDGSCYPSQARIAKDCGMSPRSVRNALGELLHRGLVLLTSGKAAGTSNRYTVPEAKREPVDKSAQPVDKSAGAGAGVGTTRRGGRHHVPTGVGTTCRQTDKEELRQRTLARPSFSGFRKCAATEAVRSVQRVMASLPDNPPPAPSPAERPAAPDARDLDRCDSFEGARAENRQDCGTRPASPANVGDSGGQSDLERRRAFARTLLREMSFHPQHGFEAGSYAVAAE